LKKTFSIFISLFAFNAFSQGAFEAGKVVNEFSGAAPVPGTIRNMAWGEAPEEYVVQPGDSLYDICDQLIAEGDYWPKLWAMNPEIKNPHFIYPGMRIRFFSGDESTPPFLQVVSDEEVIPIERGGIEQAQLVKEDFNMAKEEDWSYFIDPTPPEVVDEKGIEIPGEIAELFEVIGGFFTKENTGVHIPGFILNESVEELGVVASGIEGEVHPVRGQEIYINFEEPLQAGATYTILREGEEVYHPDSGDFVGYKYYFVSSVKVSKVSSEDEVAKGMLFDGNLAAKPGDLVVPYRSTLRNFSVADRPVSGSSPAHVVSMEFPNQTYAAEGSFIFLDAKAGVSVGQVLPIYHDIKEERFGVNLSKAVDADFMMIGRLQVIDVTEAGAVAYVTNSLREVLIGDRLN